MTSGMTRRGDRLLRPMGPWSPAVHDYLRHLEAAGFGGAPRLLGIEGDREVLTFIDGDVANDPGWQPGHGHRLPPYARTDLALRGAGRLIRKLHTAAAGFQPRITSCRSGRGRQDPGRSSPTATSARGTPSTGTGYRSRSSTGTPPRPPARWPTSRRRRRPSCPSPRRACSPRQDSTRSLTRRPGCARSWTATASPTARRPCQSCSAAHWTRTHRRPGSGPPCRTLGVGCDPAFLRVSCRDS